MFNGAFTQLLLLTLATILVIAAVIDVRTYTISNRLNLTVALLAPVYWASVALSPWRRLELSSPRGSMKWLIPLMRRRRSVRQTATQDPSTVVTTRGSVVQYIVPG